MARRSSTISKREPGPKAPRTAAGARAPRAARLSTLSIPGRTREVRLSAYYDAAAVNREQDFGVRSSHFEDAHFGTGTRNRVLARFRREVRNNPYLAGLVKKFPEAIGNTSLRSRTSSREYNDAKELFWFRWSKRCTVDGDSLRTVENIMPQEMLMAGELFHVLLANGRFQPIASEFCASPDDPKKAAEGEINGIVYSPTTGRPVAYRFGRLDERGTLQVTGDDSELVEARNVIHVFDKDRVQMGRGLPWLLPALRTARDLYEITRAKTKQIKDVNSISGFIEKQGAADWLAGMGTAPSSALNIDGTPNLDAPANTNASADAAAPVIDLQPGTFVGLEVGEKVNALVSEYHAEDYKELIMLMLHAIATPVGLPVELWFSGLGEVNFSGFKGLGAQWGARRRNITAFLEDRFYNRLQFWRISKARNEGDIPTNPDDDEDLVQWGWRRAAVLDDERVATANAKRLDSGEASIAEIWEENDKFPEEELAARRMLYIKALIAAGELEEGGDHAAVKVPVDFLLGRPVSPPAAQQKEEPAEPTVPADAPPQPAPQEQNQTQRAVEEWRPGDTQTFNKP